MTQRIAGIFTVLLLAYPAAAQTTGLFQPVTANYDRSTDRYAHNIMGSLMAHTDLVVGLAACAGCKAAGNSIAVRLPDRLVFEDFAPRIVDLNQDGLNEIVTVESDRDRGSRLTIWDVISDNGTPKLVRGATTEFIGTRFRWLSPVGAADFDMDGRIELAYVEKPHRDKVLKVVRRNGKDLVEVYRIADLTNHAIGQEEVQSRIENCHDGPRIILVDASGTRLVSVRLSGGAPSVQDIGPSPAPMQLGAGAPCTKS